MKKQENPGFREEQGTSKARKATGKKRPNKGNVHKRAYEIYENRRDKDLPGNEESDWYQAEEELFNDYF
jgi:hypothetical protein